MNSFWIMFVAMSIIVYVVDLSGFIDDLRRAHIPYVRGNKWGTRSLSDPVYDKPFFCARCLTFWLGVGLSAIYLDWSLFFYGCLFSWLAPYISIIATIMQDLIAFLRDQTDKFLQNHE